MQNDRQVDRLSWGDTVFLHLEREGMPLNVASVCVFDGEISYQAFIRSVEAKLPLIPRYLKHVVPAPLGMGLPTWEYDAQFKIRHHVKEVTLKHGSDAELKALAGTIFSKMMDRQRPLWDLTLVRGLKGNGSEGKRTGLIFRLHHCLADGIAGVGIMHVLLDTIATTKPLPRRKLQIPKAPRPGILSSLTNTFVDSYADIVKRIVDGYADASTMAERLATGAGSQDTGEGKNLLRELLPEIGAPTERLRFNVLYRGPQNFGWAEIPLAEIKAIKSACGTSVNDVVLALVTATIRRYLGLHGDSVKGRLFRIMIPVNLRGDEKPGQLGNRISLVPVTIPLDIRDPLKLLAAVHERTEFLKRGHAAEVVSMAGGLIAMIPLPARELAGQVINRLPFTPFNMVCTNVPGPQYPLYLLGRKMLHCYPYVPVGGEMTLNCAILTYDGVAYFGFSCDSQAVPDIERLESLLKSSYTQLHKAAGLRAREVAPRTPQKKEKNKKVKPAAGRTKTAARPSSSATAAAAPSLPTPTNGHAAARPDAPAKPATSQTSPLMEENEPTHFIA